MYRRTLLAGAALAALADARPSRAAEPWKTLRRPDGGNIAYLAEGSGPAIVLLPSLGRGQEDFDGIAPLITRAGFRLLRPEPRGIGGSSAAPDGFSLHDLAADVAAVIEAENGAPAVVAGHAFGNWVARVTAFDHPRLVRGVAMLAAIMGTAVDPDIRRSITASADTSLPDEERLKHLERAYFAKGNDPRVWLPGWHTPVAQAQRRAQEATKDKDWIRAGDRLPTLYLATSEDAIAPPPTEEALTKALGPQARLVVIERAGHALLPEQPEATAKAIVDFTKSL